MNRRQFLKKSLEGIVIGSIPFISCSKNPVSSYTGSISGKVIGADQTVKVRAIQNLSLITETTTNSDGNYKIEDLPEGKYGLLFKIKDVSPTDNTKINNIVFIYNDKANQNKWLIDDSIQQNEIEIVPVVPGKDSSNYNINLLYERADYGDIIVKFKSEISEDEINTIINSYNCTIKKIFEFSTGILYRLIPPNDKTVLELVVAFKSDSRIERANPETFLYTT